VGFRFPAEVTVVAVRRYLRHGLSYRDVEELLVERRTRLPSTPYGLRAGHRPW
jgi:transposase-like protein